MADVPNLASYLRARRERLTPAEVGLPDSGRRRTPGLRREEVAALAGLSIDYLVRLEQGRDTHPSAGVLAALADALLLDGDERLHLFTLAAVTAGPELCPTSAAAHPEVSATVRAVLDKLEPTPAFVVDAAWFVVAANSTWERLVRPIGLLEGDAPNLVRFTFLHPGARVAQPDWAAQADEQVGRLRAESLRSGIDERFAALVEELTGSPEFAARWATHDVVSDLDRTYRIVHPDVGELRFADQALALEDGLRMVVWLPADDETDEAVRIATVGSSGLRAV